MPIFNTKLRYVWLFFACFWYFLITCLAHLHQLLASVEGMDFKLAGHGPNLGIVQQLSQVPFVVIGHSDLLYQSILKPKRNMAHHGTQKITQF